MKIIVINGLIISTQNNHDPTLTHKYWINYNNKIKQALQNEYNIAINNANNKIIPMCLSRKATDKYVEGIDINNVRTTYRINEIPKNIIKAFKNYTDAYKHINTKPFLIMWDNIPYTNNNTITYANKYLKINNKPLEIVYNLRYLGAQLRTFDNDNLV